VSMIAETWLPCVGPLTPLAKRCAINVHFPTINISKTALLLLDQLNVLSRAVQMYGWMTADSFLMLIKHFVALERIFYFCFIHILART
jgi:hypothetical protein